ncbi:MAG: hypothetical protein M0C28_27500 [Candidatus Moduliflexus flocculans]|nr:hypothetical protein [Candidatus Moduliflexus flocculans]
MRKSTMSPTDLSRWISSSVRRMWKSSSIRAIRVRIPRESHASISSLFVSGRIFSKGGLEDLSDPSQDLVG